MSSRTLAAWMRVVACVASIAAVVACGGGGNVGSGGTGAPLGLAVGTVTGFGSVIVDGVRYDDSAAAATAEDAPGHDAAAEVKLGHRVEIEFEQEGVAKAIHVEATVTGKVDSAPAAGQFVVLGQTVVVNGDAAQGPVTQFGGAGYAGPADVKANDIVEVHGILLPQGTIQATRVEHLDNLPGFLRVTGVVAGLSGGTFHLGALTVTTGHATIVPASTPLANGLVVRVMAKPDALAGATLDAQQVRIKTLPGNSRAQVSGDVASLDAAAHTFFVGTQKVDYSAVNVSLANGQYVRVRGQLAADGTLVASEVQVRDGHQGGGQAELRGTITNFVSVSNFKVRGVTVDASQVTPENCPNGLAAGVFVEVEGNLSSTTVIATRVRCES